MALEITHQVEDGSVKFICMFPLAAHVTGDCEEHSVIQPSRTLKKYIQLWWQIKRTKSSSSKTPSRGTTSHKKFGTLYPLLRKHINKQAQEQHKNLYLKG
jgi:hypothetical protein